MNFSLLELGGCDIVLGTQWLSTLGVISWNFKKLLMGFMFKGRQILLQGIKATNSIIHGSKKFQDGAAKGLLLQIMPCNLATIQKRIESNERLIGSISTSFLRTKGAATYEGS